METSPFYHPNEHANVVSDRGTHTTMRIAEVTYGSSQLPDGARSRPQWFYRVKIGWVDINQLRKVYVPASISFEQIMADFAKSE